MHEEFVFIWFFIHLIFNEFILYYKCICFIFLYEFLYIYIYVHLNPSIYSTFVLERVASIQHEIILAGFMYSLSFSYNFND